MVYHLRALALSLVYHGDVRTVAQFVGDTDLVVALGVNYLFRDHAKALVDIAAALKPGGHFYLESNVFQDMKGYVGEPFKTKGERFKHNPMIAYWFTVELLIEQLERHFTVVDRRENEYGGSLVRGFLCVKERA
jgi:SAM-dependent methyltransferase